MIKYVYHLLGFLQGKESTFHEMCIESIKVLL